MDLEQIKKLVDAADSSTSATREEASNMLVFGRISQWDDIIGQDVNADFRGTFDLIKSKRNRILAELWSNPIDITFKAKDGADPDAAETLSGMYRADMLRSEEAIETALQDQVDCGYGAFRYVTEYESQFDDMNNYQRIRAEPINEANNVVYWDANAKKKDKSDARWCAVLSTFTKDGWKQYCQENKLTYEESPSPFKDPNTSNVFFWGSSKDQVKVAEFYFKEKKREKVLIFEDPLGQTMAVYASKVKDVIDEMEQGGFQQIGQKFKDRWIVTKYLVDGKSILKTQRVPGEHIPVVPVYGDWSRVEGREIWRGIYWDAQDAQRLHNWSMSYTAGTVATTPREKPVFYPGQIQGQEIYWTQAGEDLPYRQLNEVSKLTGQPYPPGPIATSPPPQIPQSIVGLLELTRRAVDDVTGTQLDQNQMLSGQVTDAQITQARSFQNMETFLYQNSFALAMKQAGRIYASMAAELYDVPREVDITLPDGTEKDVKIQETVFDPETQQDIVLNDISKGKFEVYADPGPSFSTQKEQARAELKELFTVLQGTPEGNIILLTYLTLLDGPKMDDLREYARKQLILQGIIEPESDEEKAFLQQAQQSQQNQAPDPMLLAAQAEIGKAQADQINAQTKQADVQVKAFKAQTERMKTAAEIQNLGIKSTHALQEITGTKLDNVQKLQQVLMPPSMRVH